MGQGKQAVTRRKRLFCLQGRFLRFASVAQLKARLRAKGSPERAKRPFLPPLDQSLHYDRRLTLLLSHPAGNQMCAMLDALRLAGCWALRTTVAADYQSLALTLMPSPCATNGCAGLLRPARQAAAAPRRETCAWPAVRWWRGPRGTKRLPSSTRVRTSTLRPRAPCPGFNRAKGSRVYASMTARSHFRAALPWPDRIYDLPWRIGNWPAPIGEASACPPGRPRSAAPARLQPSSTADEELALADLVGWSAFRAVRAPSRRRKAFVMSLSAPPGLTRCSEPLSIRAPFACCSPGSMCQARAGRPEQRFACWAGEHRIRVMARLWPNSTLPRGARSHP